MILRERAHLYATSERVWEILTDPALMELWNPKCVRCQADGDRVRVGLRYQATFRLSGPERQTQCEVLECLPGQMLTIRFSGEALREGSHVDETFRLQPSGEGTDVTHEVDFTHSSLPWWLKALMKVLDVIGHKRGKSSLDCIAELLEQSGNE